MLFLKPHPIWRRSYLRRVLVFYFLSSLTPSASYDAGATIGSFLSYLLVSEESIQNTKGENSKALDTMFDRNVNATNDSLNTSNEQIGGGSVNEKERHYRPKSGPKNGISPSSSSPTPTPCHNNGLENVEVDYNPSSHRSHLLHAIEGLDRYPNYLSRWKKSDVEALEQELQRKKA